MDTRGLYKKFDVHRIDATDSPGGKHNKCEYFVLDLTHDSAAIRVLPALASEYIKEGRLALAGDLINLYLESREAYKEG